MEQLPAVWGDIENYLKGIAGLDAKALADLKKHFEEGEGKKGIHFFLIRYAAGEVIMAKGTTSDFAAVHLQGRVRVREQAAVQRISGTGCWEQPMARRLETLVLRQAAAWPDKALPRRGLFAWLAPVYRRLPGVPVGLIDFCERWVSTALAQRLRDHVARALHGRLPSVRRLERELSDPGAGTALAASGQQANSSEPIITIRNEHGAVKPLEDRFLGITGTLWNQPRSVTLIAEDDPQAGGGPCVMLLIKRKALEIIKDKNPRFYEQKMIEFVRSTLPAVLAKNRLFRDRLFVGDVLDWEALLSALQGKTAGFKRLHKLHERLRDSIPWLAKATAPHLDGPEKVQIVERLNDALTSPDLTSPQLHANPASNETDAQEMLGRRTRLNECEVFRLNRLLLEASLPGAIAKAPRLFPLTNEEFRAFTEALAAEHQRKFGKPLQPERLENKDKKSVKKGVLVFKQGDPADSIYLILSGMVRISVELAGGQSMVNNLEADAYFGESAVLDNALDGQGMPVRSAAVETLCSSTLLRLDRDVLRSLFNGPYAALGDKLKRERQLLFSRDEQMRSGRLLPPHEPPQALADRLMLTRNLLLIDMDKCTRCDQCVQGCAEAHDGLPRFHRANPDYRFGKWEAAGACMHCLDAPCQEACPVGAITWLENQAVQIHRDRCIGCSNCAIDCPFEVIDMMERLTVDDAPSTSITKKKKTGARTKDPIVATKCDLCLTDSFDPPCVACCPYDAARRVDPVTFFPELKSWANFADRS